MNIPILAIWLFFVTSFERAEASTYTLWSGTTQGNIRTVGMAGAMTGLADNYTGAADNPAGLAFTLPSVNAQITRSMVADTYQMGPGNTMNGYSMGLAIPLGEGAASLSYSIPYLSLGGGGSGGTAESLQLKEYLLTYSRRFFENRLSFGLGIALNQLQVSQQTSLLVRPIFGLLYRFPKRFFLGASYSPAAAFGADSLARQFSLPHRAAMGLSWIPNLYFRTAFSVRLIPPETDTYSFNLPTLSVGTSTALQAHLGFAYEFLSFKMLHAEIFAGSYYEDSRSANPSRFHYTGGLELRPWIFKVATGIDTAPQYQNLVISIGISVGVLLQKLHLYPPKLQAASGGIFPKPFEVSDDWLPPHIQDNPEEAFQVINPELKDFKKSITEFPEKMPSTNFFDDLKDITAE